MILRRLYVFICLMALWMLLTWPTHLYRYVEGIVAALIITLAMGRGTAEQKSGSFLFQRITWFLLYIPLLLWDMAKAAAATGLMTILPAPRMTPGTVTVKTTLKHETAVAILAATLTLVGRTAVIDADPSSGLLELHCLNVPVSADDGQTLVQMAGRYERMLSHIFGES